MPSLCAGVPSCPRKPLLPLGRFSEEFFNELDHVVFDAAHAADNAIGEVLGTGANGLRTADFGAQFGCAPSARADLAAVLSSSNSELPANGCFLPRTANCESDSAVLGQAISSHRRSTARRPPRRRRPRGRGGERSVVASCPAFARPHRAWAVGRTRISLSETLRGRETAKAMIWAMSSAVIAVAS
jgi:hypothetical protein